MIWNMIVDLPRTINGLEEGYPIYSKLGFKAALVNGEMIDI